MRRGSRSPRRIAAVALTTVVVLGAVAACTSEQDEFCDRLGDVFDFRDLRRAIDSDDRAAVESALQDVQELADEAPQNIEDDVRAVVDAVIDSVRAVMDVTGPDGDDMPVDLAKLNDALDKVAANAQRVEEFADEKCDITTTTA